MPRKLDRENSTDHSGHGCAAVLGSGSVDSKGNEIEPIVINRGGRHIGKILAVKMRKVHRQDSKDAKLLLLRSNLVISTRKGRDSEGESMVKCSQFWW